MSRHVNRIAGLVEAACSFCRWTTAGRTWRPVKRRLAEHHADKHPGAQAKVVV